MTSDSFGIVDVAHLLIVRIDYSISSRRQECYHGTEARDRNGVGILPHAQSSRQFCVELIAVTQNLAQLHAKYNRPAYIFSADSDSPNIDEVRANKRGDQLPATECDVTQRQPCECHTLNTKLTAILSKLDT